MNYYQFYRENNKFDDILEDPNIKRKIYTKITWARHMLLGLDDREPSFFSYLEIKYGDSLCNSLTKDYSPIPNVDYMPIRKKSVPN